MIGLGSSFQHGLPKPLDRVSETSWQGRCLVAHHLEFGHHQKIKHLTIKPIGFNRPTKPTIAKAV
jgi:hypothetical protein